VTAAPAASPNVLSLFFAISVPAVFAVSFAVDTAHAGFGGDPDLTVRGVSFTPARAHTGDKIRITVFLRNLGDPSVSVSISPVVRANGKVVDSQLFSFGGDPGVMSYTTSFQWDTAGAAPGEYRIEADFSFVRDPTPFNNQVTLQQPLVLVAPGAPFPDGQPAGGTVRYSDPAEKEWWNR
jgi:hypothetical protein